MKKKIRTYILENLRFGLLKVISYQGPKYLCQCDCGKLTYVLGTDLRNGKYKSCGCMKWITDPLYEKKFLKRFYSYVKINNNGCWEWYGNQSKEGYGNISYKAKLRRATRVIWEIKIGPIPEKMIICHKCDNPKCVNIDHLFLGTNAINRMDCLLKKRDNSRIGNNHPNSKLSEQKVILIKKLILQKVSGRKIAKQFGVGNSTIYHIMAGDNWSHVKI